jgi:hypothetical protein
MCETNPCKNFEFCNGYICTHPNKYLLSGGNPNLCINCGVMFRKELFFKDDVECPVCIETKRGITQPNCEHAICIKCFRDCYYGIYNEPDFPYPKDIEEEYEEYGGLCDTPKSFLDKYPLIYDYEEECNKRFDKQEQTRIMNSRCPLCRS